MTSLSAKAGRASLGLAPYLVGSLQDMSRVVNNCNCWHFNVPCYVPHTTPGVRDTIQGLPPYVLQYI